MRLSLSVLTVFLIPGYTRSCGAACAACCLDTWTPLSARSKNRSGGIRANDAAASAKQHSAEIVLSHCRMRVRWLARFRNELHRCGFETRVVSVYSKCGKRDVGAPADATVVTQENNVGRNDHSFSHHLAEQGAAAADVVFFLKDSLIGGSSPEFRPLRVGACDMAWLALENGFACGRRPIPSSVVPSMLVLAQRSDYHDTQILGGFEMPGYAKKHDQRLGAPTVPFNATRRPFSTWLREVDGSIAQAVFQRRVVPVCYGGTFCASSASIRAVPQRAWRRFADSLSRGDNIEEGHYMERTWAALLTQPLPEGAAELLHQAAKSIVSASDGAYWLRGNLDGCVCPSGDHE